MNGVESQRFEDRMFAIAGGTSGIGSATARRGVHPVRKACNSGFVATGPVWATCNDSIDGFFLNACEANDFTRSAYVIHDGMTEI